MTAWAPVRRQALRMCDLQRNFRTKRTSYVAIRPVTDVRHHYRGETFGSFQQWIRLNQVNSATVGTL